MDLLLGLACPTQKRGQMRIHSLIPCGVLGRGHNQMGIPTQVGHGEGQRARMPREGIGERTGIGRLGQFGSLHDNALKGTVPTRE
jgi:hypothetical protein